MQSVIRKALMRHHESYEYRQNESLHWNLIGYSKFNQMQGLLDSLRVCPASGRIAANNAEKV